MMTDHGCATLRQQRAEPGEGPGAGGVVVTSFGYGHGPAPEAELTIDARRYLRNPHKDPAMRELTGLDAVVARHVLDTPGAAGTVEAVVAFARDLLTRPAGAGGAVVDGRTDPVRIAVGCVGGRHRSVALAQAITDRLSGLGVAAQACHRDVARPVIQPASPPALPVPPADLPVTPADRGPARVAQLAAVRVLAGLLQADLPPATWRVSEVTPGELSAQVGVWRGDEGERAARVRAWAAALGASARWEPYTHVIGEGGGLRVQADAGGVPVRVWTYLGSAPAAGTGADRPGGDEPAADESDAGESGAAGCVALRAAVAVLAGLLEADRPVADWDISDGSGLSGLICVHSAGDAIRAGWVNRWATELGLTPRWQPYTAAAEPGGAWRAAGSVGGVRVEVWTWLPAAPADTTTAAAAGQRDDQRQGAA